MFQTTGSRRAGLGGCGTWTQQCAQGSPDVDKCGQESRGVVLQCSLGLLEPSFPPHKKGTQNEDMEPRCEDTKLGNGAKPSREEK